MKYPFDMYTLLEWIEPYYSNNWHIPHGRNLWKFIWGKFFYLLHIDNTQIFLRAQIIHTIQSLISFFSVYFFSKVVLRKLFKDIEPLYAKFLAYWATVIWFVIFATFSVGQHLVWMQWYSVNYQITLPLTLLATGLVISIIYDDVSSVRKVYYTIFFLFLSYLIVNMHVMEYLYFLMYMSALTLVNIDKIFRYAKKHPLYFIIPIVTAALVLYFAYPYLQKLEFKNARILHFLTPETISQLPAQIIKDGHFQLSKFNRAFASMNELIYLSLGLLLVMVLYVALRYKQEKQVHLRLFGFFTITSVFVLIPVNLYTAGFFSLLLNTPFTLNRLYYSSTIYMVVPAFSYLFLNAVRKRSVITLNLSIVLIVLGTFIYSRYNIAHSQNFYKNIQSVKNSFSREKVGFNLSDEQIKQIGAILQQIEKEKGTKRLYFYAREDIAYVLKRVYRRSVYVPNTRNGRILKTDFYIDAFKRSTYKNKVLFPVPKGFPDYEPYR